VAARSREVEAGLKAFPFFLSRSPERSDEAGSLPSILLLALVAGRGVGASALLVVELLRGVIDSSAWMRFSLPLWPAVVARGEEKGTFSGAVPEVALFHALSGQGSSWQTGCCSAMPFVYACLLPPVAGAGVLMAAFSSPSAVVELLSLHLLSGIDGVGSPPFRALP
jgi:hypothetical protein